VRWQPIPDDQQFPGYEMPPQRFEEGHDLGCPKRSMHQLEVDVPEADASDRRQSVSM
jgi:hypothetical protein